MELQLTSMNRPRPKYKQKSSLRNLFSVPTRKEVAHTGCFSSRFNCFRG